MNTDGHRFFMDGKKLYKEILVWKPIDDKSVIRYRCFEILSEGNFFVAQASNFHEDFSEKQWRVADNYFFESVSKEKFDEMAEESFETLEEAIAKWETDFEEMYDEFDELKRFKKNE